MSIISKIKMPGMADAYDIGVDWENVKDKPDVGNIDVGVTNEVLNIDTNNDIAVSGNSSSEKFIVTFTPSGEGQYVQGTFDKTQEEVINAVQQGYSVICHVNAMPNNYLSLNLTSFGDQLGISFSGIYFGDSFSLITVLMGISGGMMYTQSISTS